eukprot:1651081-Ditylum_brightwellii.AAC.1
MLILSVIDMHEGRQVVTTDIPGMYLNADMEDDMHIVLHGALAEMLVHVAPQIYQKYVSAGKDNKPVLCVKLQKALYRCLESTLFFYKVLQKDLED